MKQCGGDGKDIKIHDWEATVRLLAKDSRQVLCTHGSVTKQYNLVLAKGLWRSSDVSISNSSYKVNWSYHHTTTAAATISTTHTLTTTMTTKLQFQTQWWQNCRKKYSAAIQ